MMTDHIGRKASRKGASTIPPTPHPPRKQTFFASPNHLSSFQSLHGGCYEAVGQTEGSCIVPSPERWVTVRSVTTESPSPSPSPRATIDIVPATSQKCSREIWLGIIFGSVFIASIVAWELLRWWRRNYSSVARREESTIRRDAT